MRRERAIRARRAGSAAALALAAALLAAPAGAAAADCGVPGPADTTFTETALDVSGSIPADRRGSYVQIPFEVPPGATAIRVRYSYDQPPGLCGVDGDNTLDLGVYEPRPPGEPLWSPAESRGWSGSAVRDAAIAVNGFSDEAVYEAAPKAFVHGRTTRGYRPGPLPAGEWAVELGAGWIDPADLDGVQYRVVVETSEDPDWSTGAPYEPVAPNDGVADPDEGWYAGDLHVHGEMEPGNATMTESLAYAFGPLGPEGAGLDFVTLVDHNNDVAHAGLGDQQDDHPGKLVLPGTEVTTYRGHHNNQASGTPVDFRGGAVYRVDPSAPSTLVPVQDAVSPAAGFAAARAGGGWSQINHPTIFRAFPAFCRGCAWGYDDAETEIASVDAIEVQTGPASVALTAEAPPIFNPFTTEAFAFYEAALDAGATVAAVGVSDDHQGGGGGGGPTDFTYSPIGRATTMVGAAELSREGIVEAIRAGRTYVKLFGNDGPEVALDADVPGEQAATIGDSVTGPSLSLTVTVTGAASTGRPGAWTLELLRQGAVADSVPFSGDALAHEFTGLGSGRYAVQLVRQQGAARMVELYSSPLWFTSTAAPPPGAGPAPPATAPKPAEKRKRCKPRKQAKQPRKQAKRKCKKRRKGKRR